MWMPTTAPTSTLQSRLTTIADTVSHAAAQVAAPALRLSLALILFWIGVLKFSDPASVVGLISASPFHLFASVGFVHFLGILEVTGAVLLVTRFRVQYVGLLIAPLFLATLSIFLTTPAVVFGMAGFPHLTLAGQFLLKDLVLLAAAITVAAHAQPVPESR